MSRFRTFLILFFLGFFLGPIGDYCHVLSGTDAYPPHIFRFYFFKIPFWVPFLFGLATLGIGLSHLSFDAKFGPPEPRRGAKRGAFAMLGLLCFLGLYAASGYLRWQIGGGNDIFMTGVAIFLWVVLDRTWQGIVLGLLTALVGTAVEITLVHVGAFYYLPRAANFFGVPSWLPSLYFAASVTVGNFARYLGTKEINRYKLSSPLRGEGARRAGEGSR